MKEQPNDSLQKRSSRPKEVAFKGIDLYLHSLVRNMVDNVCLHEARVEEIKKIHQSDEAQTARSEEYDKIDL